MDIITSSSKPAVQLTLLTPEIPALFSTPSPIFPISPGIRVLVSFFRKMALYIFLPIPLIYSLLYSSSTTFHHCIFGGTHSSLISPPSSSQTTYIKRFFYYSSLSTSGDSFIPIQFMKLFKNVDPMIVVAITITSATVMMNFLFF